jgi:hypothetical protein
MGDATPVETKKAKKLAKVIEGNIVTITEAVTGSTLKFNFSDLPSDIQTKFGPFGLGHKLGDSAAGKSGQEAVDSINKVWDGLKSGDWNVRAPAGEKVSLQGIWDKVKSLPAKEKASAINSLKGLGIDLQTFVDAEKAAAAK